MVVLMVVATAMRWHSHIRGAIRCGAKREEVESVLQEGFRSWGEPIRDAALRVYHAMDTTRYAL